MNSLFYVNSFFFLLLSKNNQTQSATKQLSKVEEYQWKSDKCVQNYSQLNTIISQERDFIIF